MLVQGLAFEKLVTTETLTDKLIMHQDRAVCKSTAGLCRCFRGVAEKPKIVEMLTFARHDLEDKTGRREGSAAVLGLCHHMVTLNLKEQKRLMVLNEIERRQITGKQAIEYSTVTQPEKISRFQA